MASWQVLSLLVSGRVFWPKFLTIHHQSSRCFPIFPSAHRQAMGGKQRGKQTHQDVRKLQKPRQKNFLLEKLWSMCVFHMFFTSLEKMPWKTGQKTRTTLVFFMFFLFLHLEKTKGLCWTKSLYQSWFQRKLILCGCERSLHAFWMTTAITCMPWRLCNSLH